MPKRVSILGAGVSGVGACHLALLRGYAVFLSDDRSVELLEEVLRREELLGRLEYEGLGQSERVYQADLIIVSPGIAQTSPIFAEAKSQGIPVIGELEFAYQESHCRFVALTGSSGKSTTISLIDAMFTASAKEHALCGNIGVSVAVFAPSLSEEGTALCEVSSFQLETIDTFAPDVAVIVNLSPNHLDRHASLEEYYACKFRIVENMRSGIVVLNGNDAALCSFGTTNIPAGVVPYFYGKKIPGYTSAVVEDSTVVIYEVSGKVLRYASMDRMILPGKHNQENTLAAALVAWVFNIDGESCTRALSHFTGLPHRMEFVVEKNNICFYNDSKATTAESVAVAVQSFSPKTVHLIAGGRDKGVAFDMVTPLIDKYCSHVWVIGEAAQRICMLWGEQVSVCDSLETAIKNAYQSAKAGDVILLSPGCSSFDMFHNFEDRGARFKKCVMELVG